MYQHLPIYVLHFIYYVNQKTWRSSRVVPWLLSHLAASLYRLTHRLDLFRLCAWNCKMINDIFVEHMNSVLARALPKHTRVQLKHLVRASLVCKARWLLRDVLARLFGQNRKPRKPELQQDEDRIRSPAFEPTLRKCSEWVVSLFVVELEKLDNGEPTVMVVDDKAKIGLAWLPAFARQFSERLSRSTIEKPTRAKKTGPQMLEQKQRIARRLQELKEEIKNFSNLLKLGSARWRTMVGELVIKGRSFL